MTTDLRGRLCFLAWAWGACLILLFSSSGLATGMASADGRAPTVRKLGAGTPSSAPIDLTAGKSAPGGGPREFTSTDGKFKVKMPGTPKKQILNVADTPITIFMVEVREGAYKDGGYVVGVADLPVLVGQSPAQIQACLDGAREGMIRNINGHLTAEYKTALQGKYPGREVRADLPEKKGLIRARVFLVGQRMYQIMVIGTPHLVNSPEATRMLDSLAVTP